MGPRRKLPTRFAIVPRRGGEGDGYLVTFVSDVNDDSSACLIFNATDPTAGPVATVALPERISSGTHACWAPAAAVG